MTFTTGQRVAYVWNKDEKGTVVGTFGEDVYVKWDDEDGESAVYPALEVSELIVIPQCDHMTGVLFGPNTARFIYANERLGTQPWPYCPKCGEKL